MVDGDLERAIIADLRQWMVATYAESIEIIRLQNNARHSARTQALYCLLTALAFSFAIVVVTFVDGRAAIYLAPKSGGHNVSSPHSFSGKTSGEEDVGGKAETAPERACHQGGATSMAEGSEGKGDSGAVEVTHESPMTPDSGTPAPSPQPDIR